jgi:streptogramin lyase
MSNVRARLLVLFAVIGLSASLIGAETQAPAALVALTGVVTSAEEGKLEGVLVSAKKVDSTITVTVVSDASGRYRFPETRLEPGRYALRIKAVGYDLDTPRDIDVTKGSAATADLTLVKTHDLAAQLSNAEWLASFPGTDQQKASIRNCAHCHTLERVARSRYDVDKLTSVIERMSTYPQLSFPMKVQTLVARRVGGGEDPLEQRQAGWRRQAQYLSTINLSASPEWHYQFKTLPRPKGRATRVVYTEYDLPKKTRQPHDVIVDSHGVAWYASFGEQILGKLDPNTGKVTDYELPLLKPTMPTGSLAARFDEDENIWLGMQFQGAVAKFDRKTEKFQTWSLPPELNGDYVQINQVSPEHHKVDGKVWLQDAGTYTVLRLDERSGKYEVFEPFKIPRPNIYDVISDPQNNVYFTVFGRGDIGHIEARTGKIAVYPTPTPASAPRRGMLDAAGRLWFGENRANRIGMYDTKAGRFEEWMAPSGESWPYDVASDRNGDAWAGGEYTDRVLRLSPKSGAIVEYLLPKFTNIRRVFVDNRTTPPTFWVGNNHGASIVRLEPLD